MEAGDPGAPLRGGLAYARAGRRYACNVRAPRRGGEAARRGALMCTDAAREARAALVERGEQQEIKAAEGRVPLRAWRVLPGPAHLFQSRRVSRPATSAVTLLNSVTASVGLYSPALGAVGIIYSAADRTIPDYTLS